MNERTILIVVGVLAVGYLLLHRGQPAVSGPAGRNTTSSDPLASLLGLPDPATLPLGTRSADGRYVVTQSRMIGSRPQWTGLLGGGVPGMIT